MTRLEHLVRGAEVVGDGDQVASVEDAVGELVGYVGETHARLLVQARGVGEPQDHGVLVRHKAEVVVTEEERLDGGRAHDGLARAGG